MHDLSCAAREIPRFARDDVRRGETSDGKWRPSLPAKLLIFRGTGFEVNMDHPPIAQDAVSRRLQARTTRSKLRDAVWFDGGSGERSWGIL